MAHSASPSGAPRRRREVILGFVGLVIGVVLLIVALIAVRQPHGHQAAKANNQVLNSATARSAGAPAVTGSVSATALTTPPVTTPRVTTPTGTQPATIVSSATPPASSTAAKATPPPASVGIPLTVLSNTGSTGPAQTAAARFERAGWTVTDTGSFDGSILSTAAYYDPSADGSRAAALALQEQFPAIMRVKPKFDGLPAGPVIVVVTSDYS